LQDQEAFKALQYQLRESFLDIVYKEWLEVAVLSGALQLSNYQTETSRYHMARWMFRGYGWVDPMKETQAAQLAVKAGFKTQSQVLSEMSGIDLEEFLIARKNEISMAESLGLSFDNQVNTSPETASKVETTTDSQEDDET